MLPRITKKVAVPVQRLQRRNAAIPESCPTLTLFPEGQDLKVPFQQRRQARSDIEIILEKAESGDNQEEQIKSLTAILNNYRSSHGISSKLILKTYMLCIKQFVLNCSNLEIVSNLINLITKKFPNKIKPNVVKFEDINQDLEVFLNHIEDINKSNILLSQKNNYESIKNIVTNVISFHINAKIFHSGIMAVHDPNGLTRIFREYKKFCEKQELAIFDSLVPMILFIARFHHDLHEHIEMMNTAFQFLGLIQRNCQENRPAEFDHIVLDTLNSILSFKHKTRHQIVHDVQLASKFIENLSESIKGNEDDFLEKINQHIIRDKHSETYLKHDFHDLLKLYTMILHLKKPDDRNSILSIIIEQTKKHRIIYRLLGTVLNRSIYLSHTQLIGFITEIFYNVRFQFHLFTNLEKESLYEIMTSFYRMGIAFFTPDLIKITKDLAIQILGSKQPESEEYKFSNWVILELNASFPGID